MTIASRARRWAEFLSASPTSRFAVRPPDLVVLDLAMPVMNGLEAGRVLRRLMPEVLLIMYSDIGDRYVEQQARLIGIAALIAKTQPPDTLVNCARSLLLDRAQSNFPRHTLSEARESERFPTMVTGLYPTYYIEQWPPLPVPLGFRVRLPIPKPSK